MRVLLVHQAPDDRAMYADYLRAHGVDVIESDNTDGALPLAADVDVMVTGLLMPGTFDGVELIRRMRNDARTHDKGIVVVTAAVTEQHRRAAIDAGCDSFLAKPCLPDVLVAEVRRVFSRRVPSPT